MHLILVFPNFFHSDKIYTFHLQGENEFLYVESKRARIEREREERRLREEIRVEFSAEELALATIPGADFDPARRQFSLEELKPQPIIRKRRKVFPQIEKSNIIIISISLYEENPH